MRSRRILKSARMQPLEIRWETVIAFPWVTLSSPCLSLARKLRELAIANGIICERGFE